MTTQKIDYEQVLRAFARDPTNQKFKGVFPAITTALTSLGSRDPRVHLFREILNRNKPLKQDVASASELRDIENRKTRRANGDKMAENEKKIGELIEIKRELGILPNRGLAYKPKPRQRFRKP